jgi:hypothetical protein
MRKLEKIKKLRPLWQWVVLYSTAWAILSAGVAVIIGFASVGMDTSSAGYTLIVIFTGVASIYWHWHFKMKSYEILGAWTKPFYEKLKGRRNGLTFNSSPSLLHGDDGLA